MDEEEVVKFTVKRLIELLQKFPDSAEVWAVGKFEDGSTGEVYDVEYDPVTKTVDIKFGG